MMSDLPVLADALGFFFSFFRGHITNGFVLYDL